jgi:hypothetical protein
MQLPGTIDPGAGIEDGERDMPRWLALNRAVSELPADVELWVRARLALCSSDPMSAIIGAAGRLIENGMTPDDALDLVLRFVHRED